MKTIILAFAMLTGAAASAAPLVNPAPAKDVAATEAESNSALREKMGQRQLDLLVASILEDENYVDAAGDTTKSRIAFASSN